MLEDMRERGFYWVRNHDEYGGDWLVAQWGPHPMSDDGPNEWWEVANEIPCEDSSYAQIGERIARDGK